MAATHSLNCTSAVAPVLYVAFELSSGQWKLASSTARKRGIGQALTVGRCNAYWHAAITGLP